MWRLLVAAGIKWRSTTKKKGVHSYPTTSKVFENEDHRYVLTDVEWPFAMRSLPIEFTYPSSVVVPIPIRLLAPKLKDPVPDP
ncbi:MAG: hypothetical protein NTV68_07390 [Methanomicrobiales archaeon]|nr:hypothetical protein [Methanomicrobiales archaeon]